MLTHAEALELFDRRRHAWLREDIPAYLALWAEDMTFQSPVHAIPIRGRTAYAALVHASATTVRPVRFDVGRLAVDGDVVLAEWSIAVERWADGRPISWDGMSAAVIRDGLIVTWREYWNPADLAALTPSSDRR